jgi:hypothetical protein
VKLTLPIKDIQYNIKELGPFVDKAAAGVVKYWDSRVESAAKINAKWTDRTTNARNGLIAASGKEGGVHYIVLAHRVPYGLWLEIRWSGKYAIILPTLNVYGPKVMQTFEKLLDGYKGKMGL